ncbi:MAG: 6-bladed beta-propeller [Prevotellaceae bacterium]|jgi:hypothetical protein|nr:6-bladed beta-propeller [Prevotellaceae bacterium]
MKKYLFILCLYLNFSCDENKIINNASYTIDINTIETEDTIKMSSIFKKVNTIILEDHEYAIIGMVSAVQIFDDHIFVLDTPISKKLFVFDKTGTFLRQIGSLGQGPGEYLGINDFCIDPKSREIYLLDDWSKKVYKYNSDNGKYISSLKLPVNDVTYRHIAYLDGHLYCSICYYLQKKSDNLLMKIDTKTGEYKEYLSANEYNQGWNRRMATEWNFFAYRTEPFKYIELYMNTIVAINNDSIYPYFTIKHKDWIKKENLLSDEKFNKYDINDILHDKKTGKANGIHNYFEWQDYIFFQYREGFNVATVFYNKNTGELHQYKHLRNDLLLNDGTEVSKFLYANSKAAYDLMNSSFFPEDKPFSKLNFNLNLDKREELTKLSTERFVIFEYEFK